MSEFSNVPFEASNNLLNGHEKEVHEFLNTIHGALDHATSERGNTGQLINPINDESIFAVKWDAGAPQLPEHLATLTTFTAGAPATIEARYRYGAWASMVNVWVRPHDTAHHTFSLGLRIDPRTGEIKDYANTAGASEYGGEVTINEYDTKAVVDAIFNQNPEYRANANTLSIADAFQLGIASQPDFGGEQYTVEAAEKSFFARSRMRNVQNRQFYLKVQALDRSHPNGKPSTTYITLTRHIEPVDYAPDGVLDGTFKQVVKITKEANGTISDLSRTSAVSMYDSPSFTPASINGNRAVVTILTELDTGIPPVLAQKLYPTPQPTLNDLQFFTQLATQPITEQDLYI